MKKVASISELVHRPPMGVNLVAVTLEQAAKVIEDFSGEEKTGIPGVKTLWVKLVPLLLPQQKGHRVAGARQEAGR